ncbi:hypothetical protein GOP47_0029066 [Adiantum capillus-veneris]|nr:hypothetical protein GOP47_0029066 [Adiantum capillus-veneris]
MLEQGGKGHRCLHLPPHPSSHKRDRSKQRHSSNHRQCLQLCFHGQNARGGVRVLAIYRTYSKPYSGLELKKPSATRFAAMWLLLERLYDVQTNLQKTMVSDEFKAWMEEETQSAQQDAKAIPRLCLKEEFWQEVKGLVIVVLPLYKVLRMTDMEGFYHRSPLPLHGGGLQGD